MPTPARIVCVVAARPNLMKMAPILRALAGSDYPLESVLVHTGQHYDADMDGEFFTALEMRAPDVQLQVGSGSHAVQTALVMQRFEPVLDASAPAAVLVVGDVNSTLACALTAAKKNIPVLHVEAGLRSYDRAMPEEINRILTDQLSTLLFTSEASGMSNLQREGIPAARIHFVGNVMIDTLQRELARATPVLDVLRQVHLAGFLQPDSRYALLTLHRPSNVDDPRRLRLLMETIVRLSDEVPVLFPLHPRTRAMLQQYELGHLLDVPRVACLPPQSYRAMLGLMKSASLVLTDSGGVQEETTALGVPCLTLRDSTERPVTVTEGSNAIAGRDPAVILALSRDILRYGGKAGRIPACWDGHAAERIAGRIGHWLAAAQEAS
ncbi:non-hydrolyzing UDP-N-acetylglucosamine 2-epimerase [Duganella violaceipulchra]|uniref:UDP-N-acetylglucosamine 2-epimerase (Non-hydrolyzing) n=1 Tax=Duganella violaceipulchra TaxID=2849652 RepID=A0AA41L015_9BURK|nr:UDP-N-acetylglucosamine 2-epimerase (non-hydrolyzing) [Duganella violaceicalia]MBV6321851.1 UDP-N-acetylglucosamine 2-epimerase (non-hydrolyzing) [Duganella violaceicalia]MCP2007155.1 UDP-N-acetylglucosamine 2-epimerase (non-hydrolyzing) [Duganella violaceicalia]